MKECKEISKGRIAVYSPEHKLQEEKLYYSNRGLKNAMTDFFNYYPNGYYIQVRPYLEGDGDREIFNTFHEHPKLALPNNESRHAKPYTGQKKQYRLDILKKDEKFVRPPAKYDNPQFT